jgi:hypothetical protein
MATKRERINPGRGGARFVRRSKDGQFQEVESVGRSLKQDRARKAKNTAKSGQGDRGDRKVSGSSSRSGGSSKRSASTNKRSAPKKSGGSRKSGGGRSGTARHAARR